MEPLKHECGVAMIRLRKPLSYFQQKYGSWTYGLNKLYLMMEKQHNRGQEGAGLACLKMHAVPGEEFIFRERALGAGGIEAIFENVKEKLQKYTPEQTQDIDYITHHLPYAGEIYMGHLRYSTTGKSGLSYVHPFLRRSNWRAKNLCICANFNMTNVPEIFGSIATKGQHPRMMSDTYILLEQLGHRLDRESERCYVEAKSKGLENTDITRYIEENIDVANILKSAAPVWDGGYAIMGVTGSGECFTMRDPWGIRPCFWYMNDEFLAVASERPVLQTTFDLEVDDIHELTPGQAILMRENGEMRLEQILPQRGYHACSFEHVYFSRGSDCDIYRERKEMGRRLVNPVLKAINGELDNTVISYIPNTAEASFYGLVQGFNEYLNEQKIKDIELLGGHPQPEELRRILSRRVRSEKVAWKDIKLRTFIAEGNSRKDLAAHVYDITYESLVAYKDNLVIIDDSIVRGTTLRESVIRILDRLHPKRIVIVSASPQVRYPDFYGIDMPDLAEFISFRAIIALLKQQGKEDIIRSVYKRCKEQEGRPKEEIQECVRELYAECSADEISKKTAELLRPEGVQTEIHIVYQTLEGLHKACPLAPGDWYFSGHYPTPGGRMRVNQAFINFYERNEAQLNQKQFNL
ncbi:amidophosphoribosyltransferase [Alloprevotella tannerae]|uniref:amidophosphoribosyltransferase n=1 Tax=Alloprevotella tannerae TaxID=76122 RepID=UPI0028E5D8B8|nr:amidophosphoribosyltransferase [Alloprevotella tannerae]